MNTNISKVLDKRLKEIESEQIVNRLRSSFKKQKGSRNIIKKSK
jgi:hypothetical protein